MTKKNMTAILKEANQNKEIHWSIVENTKEKIVVTNDYLSNIHFEILLHQGEGKDIKAINPTGWQENVCYLIQGTEFYASFENEDEGITKALKAIVRFFYYYY